MFTVSIDSVADSRHMSVRAVIRRPVVFSGLDDHLDLFSYGEDAEGNSIIVYEKSGILFDELSSAIITEILNIRDGKVSYDGNPSTILLSRFKALSLAIVSDPSPPLATGIRLGMGADESIGTGNVYWTRQEIFIPSDSPHATEYENESFIFSEIEEVAGGKVYKMLKNIFRWDLNQIMARMLWQTKLGGVPNVQSSFLRLARFTNALEVE